MNDPRCIALVVLCGALLSAASPAAAQPEGGYEGLVKPSRRVVMKSPVEEQLAELDVREAQRVKEGELLAQMDDRVQQTVVRLATLRAENISPIAFAKLGLADAELRLNQVEQAYQAQAANELEAQSARIARDQAKVRVDAAEEDHAQAQVQLELEQRRLERFRITAPFDGVITKIEAEKGAGLTLEEPILDLAALDPLEAEVYLPAELYGTLATGRSYVLQAGAPVNRDVNAKLDRVVPVIDPGSRRFRAVFVIRNDDLALPSGFPVVLQDARPIDAE